jgi:hypothetical protein
LEGKINRTLEENSTQCEYGIGSECGKGIDA